MVVFPVACKAFITHNKYRFNNWSRTMIHLSVWYVNSVCVLCQKVYPSKRLHQVIDEVESLASNRQQSKESNDPGDAVRVVNALLTQIDQLRASENVLILATSNITGSIGSENLVRGSCLCIPRLTLLREQMQLSWIALISYFLLMSRRQLREKQF